MAITLLKETSEGNVKIRVILEENVSITTEIPKKDITSLDNLGEIEYSILARVESLARERRVAIKNALHR